MIAEVESNIAGAYKGREALRHAINKRISSDSIKAPMMPQVARKVMTLTGDPNVGLADLSDLIHQDPALAARVVQIANSAAYRGSQEIGSLDEAVQRLGLRTLSEIILSASLRSGIFRAPGFEPEIDVLWRHSLFSAYFAKEIAGLKGGVVDSLFLCGLLHAIGKPTVLQLIVDLAQQHHFLLKSEMFEPLLEEFHLRVTTCMAEQWKLPRPIQLSCAHYKNYSKAPACRDESATTYLADRLASWVTSPGKIDDEALKKDAAFGALQLEGDGIESVLALRPTIELQVAAIEG
jgi:HD-like signal output (HDOD) protein